MRKMMRLLLLAVSVGCCLFAFASCGGKTKDTGCAHEWDEGTVISAATCVRAGTMEFKCRICGEKKTEEISTEGQHRLSDEAYYVTEPTVKTDGKQCKICLLCGAEVMYVPVKYKDYMEKLSAATTRVNDFTDSQFGGANHSTMSSSKTPSASPTSGQHPRLLFTEADMETIRAAWHNPANYSLVKQIIAAGNSKEDGKLSPLSGSAKANDSQGVLNTAIRKALLYRLTGVQLYGYEAILIVKNYLTTLEIKSGAYGDPERNYGEAMFYTGLVYDWCYPLLRPIDRDQLIAGVQHKLCEGGKMEIGFPPSGQGAISGHGSERQLLRDYLTFSIAIYDEEPTWYKFIGGRFFDEYVPVRNEYYKSGYSPQGISVYLSLRYCADLWSAWIMKSATGKIPYDEANMRQVMRSVYSRIVDGKYTFLEEGDDEDRTHQENLKQFALPAQISAYLFKDPTVAAWAEYADYAYTPDIFRFLLRSGTPAPAANRYDDLDLILYNGGYISQFVAHSGWTANDVTVMMKIGERTTANHDHGDAGSFQIYYKGLLAGDSGFYDSYSSTHNQEYHQRTIAHNSIVFYRKTSGTAFTTYQQKHPGETTSFSTWKGNTYKTGTTMGYAYGYADAEKKNPTYAYIAGDLAAAYEGLAAEVTRRMLTVFDTGRDDVKAYFFVFDHVADKQAPTDETVFLLHTLNEPQVKETEKTVTIISGNGKLVLQNLCGGDRIDKIGGKDKNFYLNGSQCETVKDKNGNRYNDGYWGRLEIAPNAGSATDTMLNVMYVCDKEADPSLSAVRIGTTDDLTGGVIGNVAAVFVTDKTPRTAAFSFTAEGSGALQYYVSGVAAGNWTVTAGGQSQTVAAKGGLLVFTAPAGSVTVSK